jgi:large subunit ribosomal protein L22
MEQTFAKAELRHCGVSSSKVRRYIRLIKGKKFNDAVAILKFMPSPTAQIVRKVLESAGANAEENHNMTKDNLVVADGIANQGPTMKRMAARAMGRGVRIRKRTSHVSIIVTEKPAKS